MKARLRILLCALLLAGCLDGAPSKPDVAQPQAVVFEQLAKAVESGEFSDSSQRFIKVAGKTLKAHGIKAPDGYDDALKPWMENHKPDDAENRAMAEKLRALK